MATHPRNLSHPQDIYRDLDFENQEFRLLIIHPGTAHDTIHADLVHTSFSQTLKPFYDTVSYAWGDAADRSNIYLHEFLVDVPTSTEVVLRELRYHDRDRTVWIDAVCINQNDISERGHQVRLMYEIYANTRLNHIWLGEDDGYTCSALTSMSTLLEEMRLETNDLKDFSNPPFRSSNGEYLVPTYGFTVDFDQESLLRYYNSSWFSRLWVGTYVKISSGDNQTTHP